MLAHLWTRSHPTDMFPMHAQPTYVAMFEVESLLASSYNVKIKQWA